MFASLLVGGCANNAATTAATDISTPTQTDITSDTSATEKPTTVTRPDDEFAINLADHQNDHSNIWDRLRAGMKMDEPADHPRLQSEINHYAKHAEYMARVGAVN